MSQEIVDLKQLDDKALKQLEKDIAAEHRRREKTRRKEAEQELKAVASKYGFSVSELVGSKKASDKAVARGKYKNPENPNQTWSGRGRRPRWINEWIENGGDIEDLRVS